MLKVRCVTVWDNLPLEMPFTVVCVFPSQQTKLDMAPSYHEGGREGAVVDRVKSHRRKHFAALVDIATRCISASEVLSHQIFCTINCQNVLESTRFRHELTTSETHEILFCVRQKGKCRLYFYPSA